MAVKICLDAGHYGKYNRSPAVRAYYESDMAWKLQEFLAKELESYGITVVKTRREQAKDLSLSSRGKAARGCDLFLSLHSNACASETVDRPVVIVQLDGRGDALGSILGRCIQEVMDTDDFELYKRKGKSGGEYYGVLRSAAQAGTVGMILEHSFHTNPRIARWLLEEDNLRRLAQAEAKLLADYFGAGRQTAMPAMEFSAGLAGAYTVVSSDGFLNLRTGPGMDAAILEAMQTGAAVRCYGYHTGNWLLAVSPSGLTGYCAKEYLKRMEE